MEELRTLLSRKANPLTIEFCWEDGGRFKTEINQDDDATGSDDEERFDADPDGAFAIGRNDEHDDPDSDLFCAVKKGSFPSFAMLFCKICNTIFSHR